jgi:hypothetical protein
MHQTPSTVCETVDSYRFNPKDLNPAGRLPGISAFMRIRNGEEFLETAIRSHVNHFDEIVAVYNRCTDSTAEILARLKSELGPKLSLFHYLPEVYPPGSDGHRTEPPESPHSLITYYNFALSRTRFSVATKLDDDHLAIEPALQAVTGQIRAGSLRSDQMACFSGFNLDRDADGTVGLPVRELFSGGGDIGFFKVSPTTYFVHDPRFESFRRPGLKRHFTDFVYWHLKYLKAEHGFANYDLATNPNSRYQAKLKRAAADRRIIKLGDLSARIGASDHWLASLREFGIPLPEKAALKADRWRQAVRFARNTVIDLENLPIRPFSERQAAQRR